MAIPTSSKPIKAIGRFSLVMAFVCLLPQMSHQAAFMETDYDSDYYTAGVVEFRPSVLSQKDNVDSYVEIIGSADASEAEIIVFPEATLNGQSTATFVPHPEELIVPCLTDPNATYYEEFFVTLSCAARNASKYVVVNLSEKQLCTDTPEDPRPCSSTGVNQFNTNVVFDREGVVISRYRKIHLYGEPRNSTYLPELSTFTTDFGVTFGHFICFDILFFDPAQQLILEQGITDFVFPTMWFSQLPYLTAVQYQQGWAYAQNVNLLAAGASNPLIGSSGSGIYHGREGTITSVMNTGIGERHIYVAKVPKFKETRKTRKSLRSRRSVDPEAPRVLSSEFRMKQDYIQNYKSEMLPIDENQRDSGNLTQDICYDDTFCCHFEVAWQPLDDQSNSSYYYYRLGAYNGWRNEQNVDANYIRNCAIFSCTGPDIEDCAKLITDNAQPQVTFTRLAIDVTYPESKEYLFLPNTVLDNLLPLEPAQFEWSQSSTSNRYQHQVHFALAENVEVSNLLTFAVYGNYYNEVCTYKVGTPEDNLQCGYADEDNEGGTAAHMQSFGAWLIMPLAVILGSIRFKSL
ncbi:vanin-like protein 1 [Drosophila willistoni]|nr:vanin-like protein 1 [Drosophila willistoni]